MREVEGLALGDELLELWPRLGLGGVREKVHEDGTLGGSLLDWEEVLALDPAVLESLLPGVTSLSDTDNDVHSIVSEVETLPVALRAVTEQSKCVVLEVGLELWDDGSRR